MDFGVTGKLGGYYLAGQYRKNAAAGKSGGVSFAELAAAKAAGQSDVSGMSFKDMWQARYPGAYYHVMEVQQYRREHGTGMISRLKNSSGMMLIHPR